MSSPESATKPPWYERPALWWPLFALSSIAILAFVPYAVRIWRALRDLIGEQGVHWALIGFVVLAAVAVVRAVVRHRARIEPMRLLLLLALPALIALWMKKMNVTAEAFHLVEYGLLGAVANRAMACHFRGWRAFVAAAAVTSVVGVLEEVVQWFTPGRHWDLKDVGLNVAGGVLAQVWIALSLWGRR